MNKLTSMARELLQIEEDLPFRFDYSNGEGPKIDDFEINTFEQQWGSTSLGFGGMGGQAITMANTYVFVPVTCNQKCFVYFGGRFAYDSEPTKAFCEDVAKKQMASVVLAKSRYKKET